MFFRPTAVNHSGRVHPMGRPCWLLLSLIASMWVLSATSAFGQQAQHIGLSGGALRGLDRIGLPIQRKEMGLSLSSGYGFTEAFDSTAGQSHRVLGHAAFSFGVTDYLALSGELRGHLDVHPGAEDQEAYVSAIGEPRIAARAGAAAGQQLLLGGELGVRIPGSSAPSLRPAATTVDLVGQLAWLLGTAPLSLHAQAGFRFDNSAKVAPDLSRLRQGDRIGLGLSSEHQVLLAVGVHYAISDTAQAFAETSWDLLTAKATPLQSPLRLTLGTRYGRPDALSLELSAHCSLSRRPEVSADGPLIPIEPRAQLMLGVRYAFNNGRRPQPSIAPLPAAPPAPVVVEAGPLRGTLIDSMNTPIQAVHVTAHSEVEGEATSTEAESDENGRFEFSGLSYGRVRLEARKEGFQSLSWDIDHSKTGGALTPQVLLPAPPMGQLRNVIRSWNSDPLSASIEVVDEVGTLLFSGVADADGSLAVDLPPGKYEVHISAQGQRPQTRRVRIRDRGVTILNVDLRPARRR